MHPLPGADRSIVDPAKIRDYLLSSSHPTGRFKAAFFGALGYIPGRWQELIEDLKQHAMRYSATATDRNAYGQKYEVRGNLVGPSGRRAMVVCVWIVLNGEDCPRFVTAFPGPRP